MIHERIIFGRVIHGRMIFVGMPPENENLKDEGALFCVMQWKNSIVRLHME